MIVIVLGDIMKMKIMLKIFVLNVLIFVKIATIPIEIPVRNAIQTLNISEKMKQAVLVLKDIMMMDPTLYARVK